MSKVVLLYSGGLDSTVALYSLRQEHEVACLSFHYGQMHLRELDYAQSLCRFFGTPWRLIDISRIFSGSKLTGNGDTYVVPSRNMVMLSIGVAYAEAIGASQVAIACNKDDYRGFADCRYSFIATLDGAADLSSGGKVRIVAPFLQMTKREVVELGRQLNVPFEQTWSCYAGGKEPCNQCPACKLRNESLL